ncbi:MAG TPA: prenyltransferase/squalene oxidase repeat-containing protein [Streptomyces sp.]|nr:prenyltransferase/squalene oxidase repeat-containing protein [Streptomyces sp.]
MTLRRSAATVLAASAVLCAAAGPVAVAAPTPSPKPIPSGLYGKTDPTYDGVFRQSLALLAQDTVGVKPSAKAVSWLTGQQCDSGGFPAYRADATEPCNAKTMVDSNATAAAVQALKALGGQDDVVKKSVDWLKSTQNQDGGWSYSPGAPTDSNSTSIVIGALAAAGEKPAEVRSQKGRSPYDALVTFAIPCDAKEGGGAFAYQPDKAGKLAPNGDATAAAVLGGLGKGLVVEAADGGKKAECTQGGKPTPEMTTANGAAYLTTALAKTGHLDTAPMPGAEDTKPLPDFGNTADAVVALAAQGGAEQAKKPLAWLEKNAAGWAKQAGPGAYAQLIFAAHATGADPKSFGGTDLVKALNATGPAPASDSVQKEEKKKDDGGGFGAWWIVGIVFVASAGAGILFSGRKKKNQQR